MPPKITQQSRAPVTVRKGTSVIDRIKGIGFDDDTGIKILLYGRSGTGKTTLWSTFPGPILSVVCSGSDQPGELRSIDTPENRKRIKQVTLERSEELRMVIDHVKTTSNFKTLVLDHATGLQDLVLKEILNLDEVPAQKSWGLASQQQYGQLALMVKEHLRALLSVSCNVVIIAQEREFNTEGAAAEHLIPSIGAALTPSLTGWLNTAVDYICETFIRQREEVKTVKVAGVEKQTRQKIKGVDYCLRTAPDPIYTTKFRVPKQIVDQFGEGLIIDPTYDKIMSLIRG